MIFDRLEIDIMQVNEIHESIELAYKYKFPAVIVHPGLSSDAIIARNRVGGKFKIITPIDWPKGEIYGTHKMRGLTTDSLETDGFEFLLTPSRSELETRSEAMKLTEFVKHHLSEQTEVRFVLGTSFRSEENILAMCNGLLTVRTPTLVRTDIHLKIQVSKANPDEHNKQLQTIRNIIRVPVKICGNIINLKSAAACSAAARFGVSLTQAKTIVKEFLSQPEQLPGLLDEQ